MQSVAHTTHPIAAARSRMNRKNWYQVLRAAERPNLRDGPGRCPFQRPSQSSAASPSLPSHGAFRHSRAYSRLCNQKCTDFTTLYASTPRRNLHYSAGVCARLSHDEDGRKDYGDGRVVIELEPDFDQTQTALDVLKRKVPRGYMRFGIALDQHGTLLSLGATLPPNTRYLHFIPIASDFSTTASVSSVRKLQQLSAERAAVLARRCFWTTSGYVLGAALQVHFQQRPRSSILHLTAAPELVEDVSGGAGFAYDFFLEQNALETGASNVSASDPVANVIQLIGRQMGETPRLDESVMTSIQKCYEALVTADLPIDIIATSPAEAREVFESNPFKLEELSTVKDGDTISFVRVGEFYIDFILTKPNVPDKRRFALLPSTNYLRAVKLRQWSTATWTPSTPHVGPKALPMTQALLRVRGITFPSHAQLKKHIAAQEAASASDHRTIGRSQALFMTSDVASPGSPFILPHGMRIGRKVERVIRDLYDVHGYDEVRTPQLFKKDLWVRSGHWENYKDDMFKVKGFREDSEWMSARAAHDGHSCVAHGSTASTMEDGDEGAYGLKPMNCPGHCLIYSSKERSYRDLPLRLAEFGPLHRNESSGSLSGLTRVRRFHQDDAHVFCTPYQVSGEIQSMLKMLTNAYRTFGFEQIELVLSTRPAQFIGEVAEWEKAEDSLRQALDACGRAWSTNEGDGAFYGPKIDCRLVDAAGRKHQTATIQLDFQLPRRFELRYANPVSADGSGYSMPVMIHRAILGSVERFMAILIESSGGRWPFWLSPRQAIVLPVADTPEIKAHVEYVRDYLGLGREIADQKRWTRGVAAGEASRPDDALELPLARPLQVFHVDQDLSLERLSKMIQKATTARYNFMLVVGEMEARSGTVSVRVREDYAANPPPALPGRPELKKEMGEYELHKLRRLFEELDTNHW
ncbi:threonyl-tRNA synthetase [Tilletiaria anomala UBC 951]|uniref:threonine--tRNA ligase n=1 Tax=Tilletiaria anomala (strain ATCC 24038 / CBS 436.72 / UBC 951) TaxID=1037660 RepID=A0A066VEI3_TILAU|nr:threonyl-tRNA synthetase [Tilletiaria anomala UBC 951]KDN40162.1 threonyl-tRNA synthetase [Tilletiaria anomala UBC 951]